MSHAHQELLQFLPSGGGDILEHSLAFLLSRGQTIFSFFYFYSTLFSKVPNMHISIYSKHCGNFRCSCLCNIWARHLRRVQERARGHRVPRGEQPRRGPVQVDLQQLRRAHQVGGGWSPAVPAHCTSRESTQFCGSQYSEKAPTCALTLKNRESIKTLT